MKGEPLDRLLDRLVDGELSEGEYRGVLESLDATPDGWRRCAVAFLEAQALRRDLGAAWGGGAKEEPRETAACFAMREVERPTSAEPPAAVSRSTTVRWLAMAASWLVVFAAGWGLSGAGRQPAGSEGGIQGAGIQSAGSQNAGGQGASSVESLAGSANSNGAEYSPDATAVVAGDASPVDAAGTPVWTHFPIDPQLVHTEERKLPSDVVGRWRERGRDLRVREHFIPVRTEDGRGMIVPVREINVAPVRNVAY